MLRTRHHGARTFARGGWTALLVGLMACETSAPALMEAEPAAPPPIASPELCARSEDDVSALFCGDDASPITSLAELRAALGLGRTLFLAHSTALDGRLASPINPRAVMLRDDGYDERYVAATFTRGAQRAELIARDHRTGRLNLYLLEVEQACSDDPGGCSFGDLYTPAIESGWRSLKLRDDEELKNTPLDCRRCHGGSPHDGGKPQLLMREVDSPWMHWFPSSRNALVELFYGAKRLEPYAGRTIPTDSPRLLERQVRVAEQARTQPKQPLTFLSGAIAIETLQLPFAVQPSDPSEPEARPTSPTWQLLFDAYRLGLRPAPPYFLDHGADPAKLQRASEAYRAYLDGEITKDDLPDIGDVLPDDQRTLAHMGFSVEPDAPMDVLLVQACGQCHNSALDPSLSRARFDIDLRRVSRETLKLASARLALAPDHPSAMPPAMARAMSAEQRRTLREYLSTIDPSDVPPRATVVPAGTSYTLAPSYEHGQPRSPHGELVIGDVSGDGRPDVIAPPWIFVQGQDGFAEPIELPITPSSAATLIDVDADGLLDIVSTGVGDEAHGRDDLGLLVRLAEGELVFSSAIASPGPTPLDLVRASFADVDGDGHLDLVSRARNPYQPVAGARPIARVIIYLGDGRGSFAARDAALALQDGAILGALTLGDVTGDDRADLILLDRSAPSALVVYPSDGDQGFGPGARHPIPDHLATTLYLSVGDGNGDGRNDIATSPGIRLMLQDQHGGFGPAPMLDTSDGPARFFDLNADGLQDLVGLAQSQGEVRVLMQGSLGLWHAESATFSLPTTSGSVLDTLDVGDLDGDGCADVAVARNGAIDVMRGKGCSP